MIKQSQQLLLEAIKTSLFGNTFSYPDDTDWDAVIEEAKLQTVMVLISPVIPAHDESSLQSKARYMRLLYEQDQLIKLFNNHNIPCVIIKGCAAAIYYPKPYLRTMGDVDFLVPRNRFDEAMKLMESNGYICTNGKNEDGQPIQGIRHIEYLKNGIEYELHHHFSTPGFDMDDLLEKAINKRAYRELNGYKIPMLPDIENGLVLLGHIHQHLNLDSLGLRQIIDWEMYFHAVLKNETREKEFIAIAKEIGLSELAVNVTKMCEKHLGLSESIKESNDFEEEIADELLENLLTAGNFGIKKTAYSGESIRSVTGIIKRKGIISYFQDNGLETWNLCKKHPVLKPFAFIYGFFRFCVRGTAGVLKTGKIKEQIRYVRHKNNFERNLGIKTTDSPKARK